MRGRGSITRGSSYFEARLITWILLFSFTNLLHESGACSELGTICQDGTWMSKLFSITLKHSHQTLFILVRLLSNTPASASPSARYLRPPQLHARRSQVAYKYKIWLTFSCLISASRWIYRLGTQQCELPFQPGFRFSSVLTLSSNEAPCRSPV